VHCPGCGGDCSLPEDDAIRRCFTCRTEWFRHGMSGDEAADLAAIRERVPFDRGYTVTFRPVVVDVSGEGRGKHSRLLDAAFVYLERAP